MRHLSLLLPVTACVAAVFLWLPALPQDPAYHVFADRRALPGIPNAANVLSNAAFLLAGGLGLRWLARGVPPGGLAPLLPAYRIFFGSLLLIGIGSAIYHLDPDNDTLVWDRLPMALAFMAFLSLLLGEYVTVRAGRRLLWPLLLAGILSVLYWWLTERQGHGDLRPYVLVQFLPLLLVPVLLTWYRSPLAGSGWYWLILAVYAASKLAELADARLYALTGFVSGHTLKHLLAASGGILLLGALHYRRPR